MIYLYVAAGGAAGAMARFAVGGWVITWAGATFPWATLAINASGSLLLGVVLARFPDLTTANEIRALLAVGFCGAFTTFSTFGYETASLLQRGSHGAALVYMGASVLLSVVAVFAGLWLGSSMV